MEPSQSKFFGNGGIISWKPCLEAESQASSQLSDLPSEVFQSQDSQLSEPPAEITDSWSPGSDSEFPSTNEELKRRFIAFIHQKIRVWRGDSHSDDEYHESNRVERGDAIRHLSGLLAVAYDPTSALKATNLKAVKGFMSEQGLEELDRAFEMYLLTYLSINQRIEKLWKERVPKYKKLESGTNRAIGGDRGGAEEEDQERDDDSPHSSAAKRRKTTATRVTQANTTKTSADSREKKHTDAQTTVKDWYNEMCVLTGGTVQVEGAHIFDVRAINRLRPNEEAISIWDMLKTFWPLEKLRALMVKGSQDRNIIPLRLDAHRFWDKHMFALRPIPHRTDPDHRLYLQMVWLDNIIVEGNLVNNPWNHQQRGTITDFRRSVDGYTFSAIMHGDVYELVTTDPEKRPLPDIHLLQLRFAVQKLLGGMRAAGALKDIFHGPPPGDIATPVPDQVYMPDIWEELIQDAKEAGVLTADAAKRWRRYVLEDAYEKHQEGVERNAQWMAGWDIVRRGK